MGTINVKGYGPLNLPDGMSQDEMANAVQSGIASGQLKPVGDQLPSSAPVNPNSVLPYNKGNESTLRNEIGSNPLADFAKEITVEPLQQYANLATGIYNNLLTPSYQEYKKIQAMQKGEEYQEPKIDVYKAFGLKDKPFYTPEGALQTAGGFFPLGTKPGKEYTGKVIKFVNDKFSNLSQSAKDHIVHGLLRSPYSIKELQQNIEASQGTGTNLGQVIGNPILQHFQENILSKIPFSGANATLQDTGREILDRGQHIVEQHASDVPLTGVDDALHEELKTANENMTSHKNELYTEFDNIAQQLGIKTKLKGFSKTVSGIAKSIIDSDLFKYDPQNKSLLHKLLGFQDAGLISNADRTIPSSTDSAVDMVTGKRLPQSTAGGRVNPATGEPIPMEVNASSSSKLVSSGGYRSSPITGKPIRQDVSLKETNIMAGALNTKGYDLIASSNSNDRYLGSVLLKIGKALKGDVKQSVLDSGHQPLMDSFKKAESYYGDEFSNVLDKLIRKFAVGKGKAEDIIPSFIKTGGNKDRSEDMAKFTNLLSENGKKLLRYGYFGNAYEGSENLKAVNPNKLKTLWIKLGDRQKQILLPNKADRKEMDNFVRLVQMNPKATNLMLNPPTGQMNMDIISAYMAMHPASSIPTILKSKVANSFLTSEKSRRQFVASLIKMKRSR